MKISKEFFDYFIGYNKIDVAKAVLQLNENEKKVIMNIWGVNPSLKINQNAKDIVSKIQRKISKKSLQRALNIYDQLEIANVLEKLSLKERNTLLKEYYIDRMMPLETLTTEEIRLNNMIIKKYSKRRLRNVQSDHLAYYKSFFKVFEEYDKSLVIKIFNLMTREEKELIYKKYGKGLDNIDINPGLTEHENHLINQSILLRMKRKLNDIKTGKTSFVKIEDLYPNIDKKLLLIRSELLSKVDQERYIYYFGEDFSKESLIRDTQIEKLNSKTVRDIMQGNKKVNKEIKTLRNVLIPLKEEMETDSDFEYRVNKALATLSNEELKLLQKKYGNTLNDRINKGQYTLEEDYFISHHLIPKIKRNLKEEVNIDELSLTEILKMSVNEINSLVNNYLNYEEILLLQKKYGKDFNDVYLLAKENNVEVVRVLTQIKNIIKTIKLNNNISYEKNSLIKDLIRFKKYDEIKELYDDKIALGTLIVTYIDEVISDEEFYHLVGYNKEYIGNLIKNDDNLRKIVSHRRLKMDYK